MKKYVVCLECGRKLCKQPCCGVSVREQRDRGRGRSFDR